MTGVKETMDRLLRELDEERVRQGLTQSQLAERIGVNQGDVSQFMRGRFPNMQLATLFRYATGLGMTVEIKLRRRKP